MLGPLAITTLRERTLLAAVEKLARHVDPDKFQSAFGASLDQLPMLIAQKTVTVAKLMKIAPPGTVDPSSTLYNSTMFLMAALLGVALIANLLVRPVDPKHHLAE